MYVLMDMEWYEGKQQAHELQAAEARFTKADIEDALQDYYVFS